MCLFEGLLHTRPPPIQALLLLALSETSTPVLLEVGAALTGKRPLIPCKVASAAGGHPVGAGTNSFHSALIGKQWPRKDATVYMYTAYMCVHSCLCICVHECVCVCAHFVHRAFFFFLQMSKVQGTEREPQKPLIIAM